jgi:hypothetical protein
MSGQIQDRLAQSYALDRLWTETTGLPPGDTKEQPLRAVVAVFDEALELIGRKLSQGQRFAPKYGTRHVGVSVPR